jgi:hypothetical protein
MAPLQQQRGDVAQMVQVKDSFDLPSSSLSMKGPAFAGRFCFRGKYSVISIQ